jgi:predicted glycosyltransferase involved in capsule biosynthesis
VNYSTYPEHLKCCKERKINYIWTKGNAIDQCNKSLAYNFGVKYGNNANFYILHDLDVLVKKNFFSELCENLKRAECNCMQTYGGKRVLYLSEDLTKKVINKEVDYNEFNEKTPQISPPIYNGNIALGSKGGSILVSREIFYKVGGFDPELFWGYSAEDQFFWEKINTVSKIAYADNPPIDMFHMWHSPSFNTNPLLYEMEKDWLTFKNMNKVEKENIIKIKEDLFK